MEKTKKMNVYVNYEAYVCNYNTILVNLHRLSLIWAIQVKNSMKVMCVSILIHPQKCSPQEGAGNSFK